MSVIGGRLVGDNTNRDSNTSLMQFGYRFGIEYGANVRNVIIKDVEIELTNVGIVFANGSGTAIPSYDNKVINCKVKNIIHRLLHMRRPRTC
jgi:hypothetical protein